MIPNFGARLKKELAALTSEHVEVLQPQAALWLVWVSGSAIASAKNRNTLDADWVSREDFLEQGPSIIHQKRF
jgi:actin-related protein